MSAKKKKVAKKSKAEPADEPFSTRDEWLKLYTWVQEDGSINYSKPRRRPDGLDVHPRELDKNAK